MLVFIKIGLLIALLSIVLQDFKERQVHLWIFILVGILIGYLHYQQTMNLIFLGSISINISIVLLIISILYLYAKLKMKKSLSDTLGLGDILFFIILAIGFSTGSFLILFTFSLIFSLLFYLAIKSKLHYKTVPLAGLQALFIGLVFLANWIFNFTNLYTI
ncbi:MAG: hypothetical protein L3J09_07090 [Flavobacteriaceae bacterium]|nr:hypothetical protein [Flavobacteriaceae bacterium]